MKYQEFKNAINKPYFSVLDISLEGLKIYSHQLSFWYKKGYIAPLKRGLYYFVDEKNKITAELVSGLIYEPSYLSMELVLGKYGIIPEMVYGKTAVTTKTTRKFSNDFGNFIYRHISPKFFFGYVPVDLPEGKYLIAQPEKALLDYFYFNLGKINNQKDIDELRINTDQLVRLINRKKLQTYLKEFGNKKLEKMITILLNQC